MKLRDWTQEPDLCEVFKSIHITGVLQIMQHIVVVDDTPALAELVMRMLTRYGYSVRTLSGGLQLIEYMRQHRPALVLLDVGLPVKDGWTLIREIRMQPDLAHIPVIAVTAHAADEDRQRAFSAGYTNYLSKPFDVQDLLQMVRGYVPSAV